MLKSSSPANRLALKNQNETHSEPEIPQVDAVVYSALASKYPPHVLSRDRVYIFVISVKRIYVSDPAQYLNLSNIPLNTIHFVRHKPLLFLCTGACNKDCNLIVLARFKPENYGRML
jgi:hypothetical protein